MGLFAQQAQSQKDDKMDDKNNEYGEQQRLRHHLSFLHRNGFEYFLSICGTVSECQFSISIFGLKDAGLPYFGEKHARSALVGLISGEGFFEFTLFDFSP